ncbi:MAG: ABC transporter permease [Betaproteobacteria bacterium]
MHGDGRLSHASTLVRLALRNLARQRMRTGVTLAAIAFGVAALIVTGGFVEDIFVQLGEALIHSQSGHLQVASRGFFAGGTRTPERFLIKDPGPLRERIAATPGVADTLLRIGYSGLLNNGRSDLSILGDGAEPEREARMGTSMRMVAGKPLSAADPRGIVVGEGVAKALNLSVGEPVTLLVNTAQGALNTGEFVLTGVFQTFSKDFDDRAVRTSIGAAHELLDTDGAGTIVVVLDRTEDTDRVAAALRSWAPAAGLEVRTWVELNDFYEKAVTLYERQFGVLQLIILIMVVMSVANSINMSVFERIGEFGTMMALGDRWSKVFHLVLTESALLGLIGALLGVLLGVALALAISAIGIPMPPPPNGNLGYTATIRIVPVVLAMAFAVGFAATTLAALLPAYRVSRTPVVDALRANV